MRLGATAQSVVKNFSEPAHFTFPDDREHLFAVIDQHVVAIFKVEPDFIDRFVRPS